MKQKVVIIGHGFTSRLAVTRSVAQVGCEVTLIVMTGYCRDGHTLNTKKPIDGYSKYVSRILYCYYENAEELIRLLLAECIDSQQKVVLIPDSDFSAAVIDSNQKVLAEHFLFPHIHHIEGAVVKWMDKIRQKSLAEKIGMNVASSSIIDIKKGRYVIPKSVTYPCFTKPLATIAGGKKILQRCDNEADLRKVLEKACNISDMEVLVEDYKCIDKEYAVLGFSNGCEVIIPGVIQILDMAHGGHYGVACRGRIMPIEGYEEIVELFKTFVLEIGFLGVFDIDFYQSNGKLYFGELNLRFGGSGYAITKMGVNLPVMLVKTLYGRDIIGMQTYVRDTATYVNERMCLDDWYFRYITTREYYNILNSSDIKFIKDDEDVSPYSAYKREFNKRYLKRMIKTILRIK